MEVKSTQYGTALIAGSLLSIVTMVLHPTGGSMEHIIKILPVNIVAHSIAIAAMPVLLFGFWGLARLMAKSQLAGLAFVFMAVGLFAAICAAALNGLALSFFIRDMMSTTGETLATAKLIMRYNMALNHAFDYIFIGGSCIATLLFAIAIIKTQALPRWIGIAGLLIAALSILALLSGLPIVQLQGFRLFVLGFTVWSIGVGVFVRRTGGGMFRI